MGMWFCFRKLTTAWCQSSENQSFVALEIVSRQVWLKYNLGGTTASIRNRHMVVVGRWYQILAQRYVLPALTSAHLLSVFDLSVMYLVCLLVCLSVCLSVCFNKNISYI